MSERYLWDRSGPPDPEIERLERALAPLRLPPAAPVRSRRALVRAGRVWPLRWAAAACLALAAIGLTRVAAPPAGNTSWQVVRAGGQAAAVSSPVRSGQTLRTGAGAGLTLRADEVGQIDLGPDSELRASTNRRLLLRRGMLHAFIWAPPRQFVVDTPSARAVDLGCEYTLTVNGSGDGMLRVAMGWVAFQFGNQESFIPAGAACVTRRAQGPGIPFYEDAPETLRAALDRFERGDSAALDGLLAAARPRDALTLWHLLTRAPARGRGRVFDRFAQLVPLPAQVSREAALRNDARAIDLCWDALGLQNAQWWRGWERNWTP